ncbi:hypothetical protein [Agrococcus sp. SGAir0287]|uniref:hypothetical protein n=1 Tax=Agrococcus sp. SGAir0287 TaxID=2070347 RepID=UPI0010CCDCF5|nr:hypothetical protein [Agrococcus sp. SGAir0287]QCR19285.1 hypothetical protein C1N71_07460 [Agrococcus sp. SGAir0287]
MNAVDLAATIREPVEHFDGLAAVERAAIGDDARGAEAIAIADAAKAATLELLARRPERAPRPSPKRWRGWLLGQQAPPTEPTPLDRWDDEVDVVVEQAERAMEAWQERVEQAWLAAATADKDAALALLVERGMLGQDMATRWGGDPVGTLLILAALAHD